MMQEGINMESTKQTNTILINLSACLLALMLCFPRILQIPKYILLGIIIILLIFKAINKGMVYRTKEIIIFCCLYSFQALFSAVLGILKSNPGAMGYLRIDFLFTMILIYIFTESNKIEYFEKLLKIMLISTIYISIYTISLLLMSKVTGTSSVLFKMDATANVGIHDGYTHITNTNLSMMLLLYPIITVCTLKKYKFKTGNYIYNKLFYVALSSSSLAIILSGRRILWLLLIFTLFINLLIMKKYGTVIKIIILGMGTILLSYFLIPDIRQLLNIMGLKERLLGAITIDNTNVRVIQAKALWEGFLNNPIFGSGAGKGVSGFISSPTEPWFYELSYNLKLYNSGLSIFIVYVISLLYILVKLYRKIKSNNSKIGILSLGLFQGYLYCLIGNATNPYFSSSFDFLLMIIIPLSFLNIRVPDE